MVYAVVFADKNRFIYIISLGYSFTTWISSMDDPYAICFANFLLFYVDICIHKLEDENIQTHLVFLSEKVTDKRF